MLMGILVAQPIGMDSTKRSVNILKPDSFVFGLIAFIVPPCLCKNIKDYNYSRVIDSFVLSAFTFLLVVVLHATAAFTLKKGAFQILAYFHNTCPDRVSRYHFRVVFNKSFPLPKGRGGEGVVQICYRSSPSIKAITFCPRTW